MEGDETLQHSLTQNNSNISHTYDHFTPSSSSIDPSTSTSFPPYTCPLPPLQNNPSPSDNLDIDWISLLSGKPLLPSGNNYEGDQSNGGGGKHKGKNIGSRMSKKSVPSKIAFHTRSSEDILDDGFKWRKYGQKSVKNSKHPRNVMDVEHLLNYPEESNVVMESPADEEIIEFVLNNKTNDPEPDDSVPIPQVSSREAFQAIVTMQNYLVQHDQNIPEVVHILHKIKDKIQFGGGKKQSTLDAFFKKI